MRCTILQPTWSNCVWERIPAAENSSLASWRCAKYCRSGPVSKVIFSRPANTLSAYRGKGCWRGRSSESSSRRALFAPKSIAQFSCTGLVRSSNLVLLSWCAKTCEKSLVKDRSLQCTMMFLSTSECLNFDGMQ